MTSRVASRPDPTVADDDWGRTVGLRPPLPAWAPLAWFTVLAVVLTVVVVVLVRPPGPLDQPDPAYQRDGLLLGGPVVPPEVAGVEFGDRPVVLLFERELLGEVVATFGLLVVIFGVVRSGRTAHVAYAVGGYITAAYWFTSSTSFANPAITTSRTLSDTFAGIAPSSAPMFIVMQLLGGALAVGAVLLLYPRAHQLADDLTHLDGAPRPTTGAQA